MLFTKSVSSKYLTSLLVVTASVCLSILIMQRVLYYFLQVLFHTGIELCSFLSPIGGCPVIVFWGDNHENSRGLVDGVFIGLFVCFGAIFSKSILRLHVLSVFSLKWFSGIDCFFLYYGQVRDAIMAPIFIFMLSIQFLFLAQVFWSVLE